MTTMGKIIIAIIIIALAALGIWYTQGKPKTIPPEATGTAITAGVTDSTSSSASVSGGVNAGNSAMTITSKDSSDVGLDQDMAAVDTQLKTLNTNSAAVDQSLSDTPITQ